MNNLPYSVAQRLQSQHLSMAEMMGAVPDEKLQAEIITGKWSALDNAAHLAVFQDIFKGRIERVLEEDEPLFPPYKWEEDPLFAEYRKLPVKELIAVYNDGRADFTRFANTIAPESFGRYGRHSVYGRFSVAELVEMMILHESHHLFIIFKLLRVTPK
ncbi:DinB family protein [Chitinophaga sp. GCM10012297]|uniref:DinB family protein n=1 Tax=Chitinophaga chungangae TaxID=2821488 RepID=A0ABS3YA78_9BACT|nr:DinB family protein [Chitinophaga chungangae]MBO9151578.1 DinB family protein [Chitinophaga chungangae]